MNPLPLYKMNYQVTLPASRQFVYNPSNFGGYLKREICLIKAALKVTIGPQNVTEEVLRKFLIEVEGTLNSKPLGFSSSEIADLDPMTWVLPTQFPNSPEVEDRQEDTTD